MARRRSHRLGDPAQVLGLHSQGALLGDEGRIDAGGGGEPGDHTAYMECIYKISYYLDTIKFEKGIMMGGEFILLVGPKISKYYKKVTDKYERI